MHPCVCLAFDCSKYNNLSYVSKCRIKFAGIRFLRKNQGYKFMEKMLNLYNEIYELKSNNLGQGHPQTIDVTRHIVQIEKNIMKMKENTKNNKKKNNFLKK